MQENNRFIRTLQLRNLLSFGPDSPPIEFGQLNVLIGPNGSGKSNVIGAIDLLRSSATDVVAPIREGGGTEEWLWKGSTAAPVAEINATIENPGLDASQSKEEAIPLRHRISFSREKGSFKLVDEVIEDEQREFEYAPHGQYYYRYRWGSPVLSTLALQESDGANNIDRVQLQLRSEDFQSNQSIVSQRKDPRQYPEITYLDFMYRRVRLYGDWDLGQGSKARLPQSTDLLNNFLAEDASNLGLYLNHLSHGEDTKSALIAQLKRFYDQFSDLTFLVQGGTLQTFFREQNLQHPVPASRLSDGTLRFLCLASVLCNPFGTSLICIEEPEIGLHPDIIPTVAEMLVEASERTQIIVTTHSDILVDALSHIPEAVLVCEKESNSTTVGRLDENELRVWLKKYSLGELWLRGELGGNRW